MLAQRHSSVFHAGVIGQGPRKPPPENNIDKEIITLNSTLLMDVIKVIGKFICKIFLHFTLNLFSFLGMLL